MTITIETQGSTAHVCVSDEMTIYTANQHKRKFQEVWEQADDIELDLSAVNEMDCAGVQLLIQLKHEANLCGKSVRYLNHSQLVLDVFELLNLTSGFSDPVVLKAKGAR